MALPAAAAAAPSSTAALAPTPASRLLELRGGIVVLGPAPAAATHSAAAAPAAAAAVTTDSLFVDTATGRVVAAPAGASADAVLDCSGCIVAPGFIDLQFNGGWGVDFSVESVRREEAIGVLARLPATGVTAVVPTLVSSSAATYAHAIPLLAGLTDDCRAAAEAGGSGRRPLREQPPWPGSRVLGVHLEGPWLAPDKKGAHAPSHLRTPAEGLAATYSPAVEPLVASDGLAVVTLAPELPGALGMIRTLAARNIIAAIGHTTADYALARAALAAGARLITHLFNAMPPFGHREPGLVGVITGGGDDGDAGYSSVGDAATTREPPAFSLIADGAHVHPAAVRLAARAAPDGLVLVTDAMRALGIGVGAHNYGDLAVTVHAGREEGDGAFPGRHVVVAGTATLAGAVAPMIRCVRNLQAFAGLSAVEAIAAATWRPAALLGRGAEIGHLHAGALADIVVLRRDDPGAGAAAVEMVQLPADGGGARIGGDIALTLVGGRIVHGEGSR